MNLAHEQRVNLELFGKARLEQVPLGLGQVGQLTLLKGRNGVGKTSLLRALAGVLECESLHLLREKMKTSYCGAAPRGMLYNLSGRENIKLYLCYQRQLNFSDIETIFKHQTYHDALNTSFKDCSSGMKKLLLLAHCFLIEADVYLLDEPFTHLDDDACIEIDLLIKSTLKKANIFLVDHTKRYTGHQDAKSIDLGDYHKSLETC